MRISAHRFALTRAACGTVSFLAACSRPTDRTAEARRAPNGIEGTWRVVAYTRVGGNDDIARFPFGTAPHGYLVYDRTGHVFFQVTPPESPTQTMRGRWDAADSASLSALLRDATAFFGEYSVDAGLGVIIHRIEGELPPNIGTMEQATPFALRGDTLQLGKDSSSHWLFVRVAERRPRTGLD